MIERVFVAGTPLRDEAVLELARLVDDSALADKLEDAHRREVRVLSLRIPERIAIVNALEEAPPATQLRAVLREEHVARKQTGL